MGKENSNTYAATKVGCRWGILWKWQIGLAFFYKLALRLLRVVVLNTKGLVIASRIESRLLWLTPEDILSWRLDAN